MITEKKEPDLYRILASIYEEKEEYEKAIEVIEDGLKYNENNIDLIFRYGVILDKSGDKDGSIAQMKRILSLDPNNADSLNYIGYTYAERGINLDEALDLIQKALKIKPNSGYIIDSLGWVYYKKKDHDEMDLPCSRHGCCVAPSAYRSIENPWQLDFFIEPYDAQLPFLFELPRNKKTS